MQILLSKICESLKWTLFTSEQKLTRKCLELSKFICFQAIKLPKEPLLICLSHSKPTSKLAIAYFQCESLCLLSLHYYFEK